MKKSLPLVLLGATVLVAVLGGSAPAARESSNRVVCVSYGDDGEARMDLRSQPRRCTFVHRNQKPFGYNTVDMIKLRWKSWGKRRARAKGKNVVNMVGPTPARVTLSRPRSGCGDRTVFTRATISARGSNDRAHLPLDACT